MLMRDYEYGDAKELVNYSISEDQIELMTSIGEARTLLSPSGDVLASVGVTLMYPGVATVWAATGVNAPDFSLSVVRSVRGLINDAFREYELHRIQTTIRADDLRLEKWMGVLGFVAESIMTQGASDKTDLIMYVKLKGH